VILRRWDDLPEGMKNKEVRRYYEILNRKKLILFSKRIFDLAVSILLLIILLPFFVLISAAIKIDSKGPIVFRQIRVTQYGKQFRIFKFRTMVNIADKIGTQVTTRNDARVTNVGKFLRKLRLDEIPQLFNILFGDMTFVGTRPEVVKYVNKYTDEMMATLLLPAGVTSEASIEYRDEEKILVNAENAEEIYINEVLPEKMKYNLRSIERFSFWGEVKTMVRTVVAVLKKNEQKLV
jgi:Sugar transferases involved in lipopolysaccharide synthesis